MFWNFQEYFGIKKLLLLKVHFLALFWCICMEFIQLCNYIIEQIFVFVSIVSGTTFLTWFRGGSICSFIQIPNNSFWHFYHFIVWGHCSKLIQRRKNKTKQSKKTRNKKHKAQNKTECYATFRTVNFFVYDAFRMCYAKKNLSKHLC